VAPSPETPKRSDFGLPEQGFVFCSFNHEYKINPPMFKIWMDLLKEVPGSVLWLMKLNEAAQTNLTEEAIRHGVDPARLVYATRVPLVEDHLARYRLADLFLDTFPYNGHTTAGDALCAGIPIVGMFGGSFASRVAASLLNDVELPQYACETIEEYYNTALRMSQHPEELTAVRTHMAKQLSSSKWPHSAATQGQAFAATLAQIRKETNCDI
jgi:predicted O-linked N-acetylglucosamine transferase (SPINDLY family)